MQLIELTVFWTIFLDCIAWFIIHMSSAIIALKIPDRHFDQDVWPYKVYTWEKGGYVWQQLLHVRSWKDYLPDGGSYFKSGFQKKQMQHRNLDYYRQFIRESRRGEFTHWLAIIPAPLFFLWNPISAGWIMILYSLLVNGPCIIAQRYNRPRFLRLIKQLDIHRGKT